MDLMDTMLDNVFDALCKAVWTTAFINTLPDSSFAVVEPAYKSGQTKDKRARHLPYKDASGKIDLPHLRNALARVNQINPVTDSISAEELRSRASRVLAAARKSAGIREPNKMEKSVIPNPDIELEDKSLDNKKRYKISDLNLNHIALVTGVPAVPGAVIRMYKSLNLSTPDGYDWIEKTVSTGKYDEQDGSFIPVIKSDKAKKMIWVTPLIPNVRDRQGDIISPEEIEKTRTVFMKNLQGGNIKGVGALSLDHVEFNKNYGSIIDTFIDYNGTFFGEDSIEKSWVLGIELNDDTWEQFEKGDIKGVSVGGVGKRVPDEEDMAKMYMDEPHSIGGEALAVLNHLSDRVRMFGSGYYNELSDKLKIVTSLAESLRIEGKKADKKTQSVRQ